MIYINVKIIIVGPYGIKLLNETLMWHIQSQVTELRKLVLLNKEILIALRTNFDKPEIMKELFKRLQNVDSVLQRMTIIGKYKFMITKFCTAQYKLNFRSHPVLPRAVTRSIVKSAGGKDSILDIFHQRLPLSRWISSRVQSGGRTRQCVWLLQQSGSQSPDDTEANSDSEGRV